MSNKAPLFRMIVLIVFFIIILGIFSNQISNNIVYDSSDPFFKDNFIWQHNKKAYTLLLHSVAFNDNSISAYSVKFDTLMTFSVLSSDISSIYNKLGHRPYTPQQCNKCHNAQ